MPLISRIGRRSLGARLLLGAVYVLLVAGGASMLYPFLLMLATSVTGETDYREYRLVPRYFTDREARFAKCMAEKYQLVAEYSALHGAEYRALKDVGLPVCRDDADPPGAERRDPVTGAALPPRVHLDADWAHVERRVALWREFKQTLPPAEFGVWYVGRRALPGAAEMRWRQYLRQTYRGNLDALNRDLGKDLSAFTESFAPYEKPEGRLWPGVHGREGERWAQFKQMLDARYRRPVDSRVLWQNSLRFRYRTIGALNQAYGTDYADFRAVPFLATCPAAPGALARDWERIVRQELPYRCVDLRDGHARYRQFLLQRHGALPQINAALGTHYALLDEIRWPPEGATAVELDAVSAFLREIGTARDLAVRTPDQRYGAWLEQRCAGGLARLNQELGTRYSALGDIRPPYDEEDLWEFRTEQASWMGWFLTRNYAEVIDYIAIRGRALWNTLLLVSAMLVCALTVNPLAAYALSRFRLSYTNQVLLFLLATMAFPYEVTMIPSFLLLRRFPLWTGLAGLGVGVVVAAVVLRQTAGRRRWLAAPAGLGAAVVAFYATALIGRAIGMDVGEVSLLNTFAALILPRTASGYGIFLLKGFFDSLPEELFEAGAIDGASELRMLWQVAFPLSRPVLAVLALQTFTAVYTSYLWALVVCQDDRMWTLMVYLFQLQQWAPPQVTMAATVLASIPTLLVFLLAQNAIMRGIVIPVEK